MTLYLWDAMLWDVKEARLWDAMEEISTWNAGSHANDAKGCPTTLCK